MQTEIILKKKMVHLLSRLFIASQYLAAVRSCSKQ